MQRVFALVLALAASLNTGCAMTRSTLETEDGATMKSWALATAGSKVTGRDLQQAYRGTASDGSDWEATTGEHSDEISSDAILARLLADILREALETR